MDLGVLLATAAIGHRGTRQSSYPKRPPRAFVRNDDGLAGSLAGTAAPSERATPDMASTPTCQPPRPGNAGLANQPARLIASPNRYAQVQAHH